MGRLDGGGAAFGALAGHCGTGIILVAGEEADHVGRPWESGPFSGSGGLRSRAEPRFLVEIQRPPVSKGGYVGHSGASPGREAPRWWLMGYSNDNVFERRCSASESIIQERVRSGVVS